jgi:hypothetical protein
MSSRRFEAGHLHQRCDKARPVFALGREYPAAAFSDAVIAAAALTGPLDPSPADQAAFLEAIQRLVERRQRELQRPARAVFDVASNVLAV